MLYSDPDRIGEFITDNDSLTSSSTIVHYTVSGLIPLTSYIVRVTTHNAVSDQDPNIQLRMCEISNMTLEGGKIIDNTFFYIDYDFSPEQKGLHF